MINVNIDVPDGDYCIGCRFLLRQPREVAYGFHKASDRCLIFDIDIYKIKKCDQCKLASKNNQ